MAKGKQHQPGTTKKDDDYDQFGEEITPLEPPSGGESGGDPSRLATPVTPPPAPSPIDDRPKPSRNEIDAVMAPLHSVMVTGYGLPQVVAKQGVDPLLVDAYLVFRRLLSGGLISPYAGDAFTDVEILVTRLKSVVEG